jgi:hypothetical protein
MPYGQARARYGHTNMPYGQGPTRYGVRKGVSPVRKGGPAVRNDAIKVRKGYLWFRIWSEVHQESFSSQPPPFTAMLFSSTLRSMLVDQRLLVFSPGLALPSV